MAGFFTRDFVDVARSAFGSAVDRGLRARYLEKVIAPALLGLDPLFGKLVRDSLIREHNASMTARLFLGSFLGLIVLRLLDEDQLQRNSDNVPDALADLLLDGLTSQ